MKVIVPIKQVYDLATVRVSRSRGILDTREAALIMNPADRYPLEEALALKADASAQVVAVTMGPAEAEDMLREALAMGVDDTVLLADEAFSSVDASAAVMIVGEAINKIGDYDLILTGHRSTGEGTGEFAPRLAQYLGLRQILRASGLQVADGKVTARRRLSSGYATWEAPLPAVVSVDQGANKPRHPSLSGSIAAYEERIVTLWRAEDLGLTPEAIAERTRTEVKTSYAAPERERGRLLTGEPEQTAGELLQELKARGLLQS